MGGEPVTDLPPLEPALLPRGVRARFVKTVNGLRVHLLEAGHGTEGQPLVLLLHGFPEIAYSFRKIIVPLADAGYHVVAPDLRGFGRTTGAKTGAEIGDDADLQDYGALNAVRDTLALVAALGYRDVAMLAGHDYGAAVSAACALVRPDIFRSVVMMSAPFGGPPGWGADPHPVDLSQDLAALTPPRKHYQWYYATPEAAHDMDDPPQGLHDFLRAYFHHKSADWAANRPHELAAWSAAELAKLPTYYVMHLQQTMPATVAEAMPSAAQIAACRWLPDAELAVYAAEYARTGFRGGLLPYRARTQGVIGRDLATFTGRTVDIPAAYFAGARDWGTYQKPGDYERMQNTCTDLRACELIDGAGHWLQQEQPEALLQRMLRLLNDLFAPSPACGIGQG